MRRHFLKALSVLPAVATLEAMTPSISVSSSPYAINWQIKENVFVGNEQVRVDLKKLIGIVRSSGDRGYLPIETLGAGNPKEKVPAFFREVRAALAS